PTTIAGNISLAINDTTMPDPFSGLPLNTLVVASSQAEVITLDAVNAGAPLRLGCSAALAPTGSYTPGPRPPAVWTATVEKFIIQGVTTISLTTAIDGVAIQPVFSGESNASAKAIADAIVSAINNSTQADPVTGSPLNSLVQASAGEPTGPPAVAKVVITI